MYLQTILLFLLYGFCLARVQPHLSSAELSLSNEVKERLNLVNNDVLYSIWNSDVVSSCDVKKPTDDKLNNVYFLSFTFDRYLCLMLHDISLYYLNISSKVEKGNAGSKQINIEHILKVSPPVDNFCQVMKDIALPPEINKKREWVERFNQLMRNSSECTRHCIADVGVNPLCALILWGNHLLNFMEDASRQHAAGKGNFNGAAVSNNEEKLGDVNRQPGTVSENGDMHTPVKTENFLKKTFPSSAHAIVPSTTGVEGTNKQGKPIGGEMAQSMSAPSNIGTAGTGESAEGTTWSRDPAQHILKGQNTTTNVAINNVGDITGSAPMRKSVQTGGTQLVHNGKGVDVDEGGGQGVETGDEVEDSGVWVGNEDTVGGEQGDGNLNVAYTDVEPLQVLPKETQREGQIQRGKLLSEVQLHQLQQYQKQKSTDRQVNEQIQKKLKPEEDLDESHKLTYVQKFKQKQPHLQNSQQTLSQTKPKDQLQPQGQPQQPPRPAPGSPPQSAPGSPQQPAPGSPQQPAPGSPQQPAPGSPQQPAPGSPQQPAPGSPQQPAPGSPQQPAPGLPPQPAPGLPPQPAPGSPPQPAPEQTPEQTPEQSPEQPPDEQQPSPEQQPEQSAEEAPPLTSVASQRPAKTSQKAEAAVADEDEVPENLLPPESGLSPEDTTADKTKGQKESPLGQAGTSNKDDSYDDTEDGVGDPSFDQGAFADEGNLNTGQKMNQLQIDSTRYSPDRFPDVEDSHFFAYFMTMMILCIVGYLIFHNKQKILALALEGRSRRGSRRRPNTSGYRKLDSNLEEAVTSGCSSTSVTHVIY